MKEYMLELLKDPRVLTALVGLVVLIAGYIGLELPKDEMVQAVTGGDTGHVLTLIIGAFTGLLGGYGAAKAKAKAEKKDQ